MADLMLYILLFIILVGALCIIYTIINSNHRSVINETDIVNNPYLNKKFEEDVNMCKILLIVCIMGITIIFGILADQFFEPSAIDVYREKTTLEITYRDSIPLDSVVVFK